MADLFERFRLLIVAFLCLAIAVAIILFIVKLPRSEGSEGILIMVPSPSVEKDIKVYVSGAVAKPGVYRLMAGDRVEDAVKAAGGVTPEAYMDSVNLAVKARDEMHVYIPRVGEPAGSTGPPGVAMKIGINTASVEQLESLPGVGPVTAKRIVDYRSKNGSFKSIEDLRDLKLVNASTFDKIRDLIAP